VGRPGGKNVWLTLNNLVSSPPEIVLVAANDCVYSDKKTFFLSWKSLIENQRLSQDCGRHVRDFRQKHCLPTIFQLT
jgi:hypothetical protein